MPVNDAVGNITISNVRKVFNPGQESEIAVLNQVSLEIKAGEFVSLLGPSGCGKSTLLRLIAGLDNVTDGNIALDGQQIENTHYERGLVFQDPTLFPWLNVHDNISFGLKTRNVYKEKKELVDEYINLVDLKGFEKCYPHQLSGGMAQRVSLARSLVNHPKVLLLDEPFGALDAFTRMYMQEELLRIWQERGTTMLLVTHDVDEAIYLSDRIVIMSQRPSKVESILDVNMKHPRERNNSEFLDLRVKILETFHFARKPTELNYYL